MLRGLDAWMVG